MFKVVDTFNGWEGDKRYKNEEEAEDVALDMDRERRSQPGQSNVLATYDVVDSRAQWKWDYRANKFRWTVT